MKSRVTAALADAFEHHRRGQLAAAEAGYREVLEMTPDQPDALHRLGIIAHQVGRNELALQLIDRATAVNPAHPTYHHDAGLVLHALGRIDDALARYRRALSLEPRYPKAHNGVGIALNDRGRLDEAAASFRAAVSLKPDYIEAWNNLGNVMRRLGDSAEARRAYLKALELGSGSVPLWNNIGGALQELGAFDDAARAYRKVLQLEPDSADARSSLGDALSALGHHDDATMQYARALRLRETPESIAAFVHAFVAAELRSVDDDVRAMAVRALTVPWLRPARLAMACIRAVASADAMRACVDRAWNAWPSRLRSEQLFGDIDEDVIFDDLLLRTLLESAPVCDLHMERFLTMVRHALLDDAVRNTHCVSASRLAFACALARQCAINDYVYAYSAAEIDKANALRERLSASLCRGDVPSGIAIAVVCTYFPLLSIPGADSLLSRPWSEAVAALLDQQLREPIEEQRLRDRIPRLTAVDDEASIGVRRQYEEHPYPKWVKLPPLIGLGGDGLAVRLTRQQSEEPTSQARILVAGCGTGQESIEVAQQYPGAQVLAVDLSLASLAYAERKARELGIENVEHAQADLAKLGSLETAFDIIYCVGVLHHLADPIEGWRRLVSLLTPGGRMLVGLYSDRSRQDVSAAKAFIAERGYAPTAADIRRCRQDLMSFDHAAAFARLAFRADFYVTGECRDLLFHVQDHHFTLPQIRSNLQDLGLRFDGFVLDPQFARRQAERFGSGGGLEDLEEWEAFEAEFPDAFAGMYIFWVRKD